MKQAVQKLSAKYEETLAGLHSEKSTGLLCSKIMISETMLTFHSEGVLTDDEFREAMSEIDRIYPVK